METDKRYLLVGFFVLATIFAALFFTLWLAETHGNDKYTLYRIRFAESVNGLVVGSPVKFHGMQVGKVETMSIDPHDIRLIQVDISILKSSPIKTDTTASLKLQGITGAVYIELTSGNPESPDLASNDKDNPPEILAEPSTLNTIMDILPQILKKVSHITDQADKLLSDKNIDKINSTIGNVQKASSNAKELTNELKENPTKLIFAPKKKKKLDD